MLRIFGELNDQLFQIEPGKFYVPTGEVGAREHVVAVLDDEELKRLYTASVHMLRDAKLAQVHAQLGSGDEVDKYRAISAALEAKGKLAIDAFWASLKDKYTLWNHRGSGIGIRSDWKVVTMEMSKGQALLADLLGIDIELT